MPLFITILLIKVTYVDKILASKCVREKGKNLRAATQVEVAHKMPISNRLRLKMKSITRTTPTQC